MAGMDSICGYYQAIPEFGPATGRVAGSNPAEGTRWDSPHIGATNVPFLNS